MSSNTVLKATDLNKSFSGIVAAKDINVTISQGEIVGIIGANGAGKTVFVNMITGYLKPTSGTVEFLERDITGIEPRNSALAKRPYNTIENARDNIAKNISLYFRKINPRKKPSIPAAITAIVKRNKISVISKYF